jgi:hypothetical protein
VYIEDQFIEEDTEVVDTEEIIAQDPVIEEEEEEEEKEEEIANPVEEAQNAGNNKHDEDNGGVKRQTITFDDVDRVRTMNDTDSTEELVNAPKTLERLEEISMKSFAKRKEEQENDDDDEDENDALQIGEPVSLGDLDIDMFSENL